MRRVAKRPETGQGGGQVFAGTGYLSLDFAAQCAALRAVAWLQVRGGERVPSRSMLGTRSAKAHKAALAWLASIRMCEKATAGKSPRWLVEPHEVQSVTGPTTSSRDSGDRAGAGNRRLPGRATDRAGIGAAGNGGDVASDRGRGPADRAQAAKPGRGRSARQLADASQ